MAADRTVGRGRGATRGERLLAWPARLAAAVWGLLTSVRFAVLLITLLAVAGLIGTLVRQFSPRALADPGAWAAELEDIHQRWDAIAPLGLPVGAALVELFERLGFFRVFSSPWFLALLVVLTVSIVCCTLDRLPRLWREVRRVRVEQPAAFFDPRLTHRAVIGMGADQAPPGQAAAERVAAAFRARRFRVRHSLSPDGSVAWVYGDRNRSMRLATLLTHAGLVLFLLGGAATVAFGFETVLFVGEGQTAPVQPVGTPGNLIVKNLDFEAPRRADGSFEDFRTDLAVYRDGGLLARKSIRVNDPLEAGGFTFHQNTFGPSPVLAIRDARGELAWSGPVILAGELLGLPQGFMTIPGSDLGLLLLLDEATDGTPELVVQGVTAAEGSLDGRSAFLGALAPGGSSAPEQTGGYAITWERTGAWTGMIVRRDPGQPIIWVAFGLLVSGLVLTFYFPRRRAWARIEGRRVSLALLADRYVDADRELEGLRGEVTRVLG